MPKMTMQERRAAINAAPEPKKKVAKKKVAKKSK